MEIWGDGPVGVDADLTGDDDEAGGIGGENAEDAGVGGGGGMGW